MRGQWAEKRRQEKRWRGSQINVCLTERWVDGWWAGGHLVGVDGWAMDGGKAGGKEGGRETDSDGEDVPVKMEVQWVDGHACEGGDRVGLSSRAHPPRPACAQVEHEALLPSESGEPLRRAGPLDLWHSRPGSAQNLFSKVFVVKLLLPPKGSVNMDSSEVLEISYVTPLSPVAHFWGCVRAVLCQLGSFSQGTRPSCPPGWVGR